MLKNSLCLKDVIVTLLIVFISIFSFLVIAEEENITVVSEVDTVVEKTIQQHLDEIAKVELTHGAHHEAIGETLISLSKLYLAQGDHLKRRESLKQALHIHRINYGLESEEQFEIIEQLISTNMALKDWFALDQNYEYFYWVSRRVHGTDSLALLPALNRIMEWKLKVVKEGLYGHPDIINHEATMLLLKIRNIKKINTENSS